MFSFPSLYFHFPLYLIETVESFDQVGESCFDENNNLLKETTGKRVVSISNFSSFCFSRSSLERQTELLEGNKKLINRPRRFRVTKQVHPTLSHVRNTNGDFKKIEACRRQTDIRKSEFDLFCSASGFLLDAIRSGCS